MLISLAARPLLLGIRALISFYVIATVDEPYDILLLFAFVALFKAWVDRNKSIRFLGKNIEYKKEFWIYIYEIIATLIITLFVATYIQLSWIKFLIVSSLTISEIFFSLIALKYEKRPIQLLRLAIISLVFTSVELFLFSNIYTSLALIGITNILLATIVLREELFNSNPKPNLKIPDFYIMLQSFIAFGAKYIYIYFDGVVNESVIQIFLVVDVYLFLFNVIYPVFRSFHMNSLATHLVISSLLSAYLFFLFGALYAIIFFLSYIRLYYTAILVNDKRNTSIFLYVSVFDLISRFCLISFLSNLYIIIPAIAGSMMLTIIYYARARDIGYNNTLS